MKAPLVSIIIPAYNAARYLPACLGSILSNTNPDFEIVIVDDGSTDSTLEICRTFSQEDERIIVLSQENSGAASARNRGLDIARGKWISFIDADDWVDDNFLELTEYAPDTDLLFFGFYDEVGDTRTQKQISENSYDISSDLDNALNSLFLSKELFFGFTWNKFYCREIIEAHRLRFNEKLVIKEDEEFLVRYCRHITSLHISSSTPYHYRITPQSVSHGGVKHRRMIELASAMQADICNYPWNTFKLSLIDAIWKYYYLAVLDARSNAMRRMAIKMWDRYAQEYMDRVSDDMPLRKSFLISHGLLRRLAVELSFNPVVVRCHPAYIKTRLMKLVGK